MSSKLSSIERRVSGIGWKDLVEGKYEKKEDRRAQSSPSFARDDLARFLFASLMRERHIEANEVPEMPVLPEDILGNMDSVSSSVGFVSSEGSDQEEYFFQHGKVIKRGVEEVVMADLIDEAASMAASGSAKPEDWDHVMESVRAAQFLVDFLARVADGDLTIYMKRETVARYLVHSLMFSLAIKKGVVVKETKVPGGEFATAVALSPDQVLEAISPERVLENSTSIKISAFSGAAKVEYRVPTPSGIFMSIIDIKKKSKELVEYYKGEALGKYPELLAEEELKLEAIEQLIRAFNALKTETNALSATKTKTADAVPQSDHANDANDEQSVDNGAGPVEDSDVARQLAEQELAAQMDKDRNARPLTGKEKKRARKNGKEARLNGLDQLAEVAETEKSASPETVEVAETVAA